ncbi:RNA12 protein-domain-containing protein [Xylariaceae sp. FL0016]|nr:RNA12 protein-domain-containing protein [Xylariaceae sp. FL0016]
MIPPRFGPGLGFGSRVLPGLQPRCAYRPLLAPRRLPEWVSSKAWETTTTKAKSTNNDQSGHIEASPNESILWLDNLFPLKLSGLLRVPWISANRDLSDIMNESTSLGFMDPMKMVKRALPKDVPVKVTEILPRIKDGGAFVKFQHQAAEFTPKEIESAVNKHLEEKSIKPFFSPFRKVQSGLVKGIPWLEDLARFPTSRLRVEFAPPNPGEDAVELSQETLYSLFRRYGKIAEIVSQPWDSKVLPKYAYVDFVFVRDAIMARNCLHGFIVPEELGGGKTGTKFRMSFEKRAKQHRFWDWMQNHPRIVIPVLVALLTGLTVVIFDPIRSFFVKAHVSRKFRLSNSRLYRWLRKQTTDIFSLHREKSEQAGLNAVWEDRKDLIQQIQTWLMETAETFIVVQGPRGSGKKELVLEQALEGRSNVLVIDCKPIVEARGESATLKKLANEVGYRPIFSWANSISSMLDLAVQSTTGVKAGFSETLESQLQKILQTTAGVLQDIDVSHRHKLDADASLPADAYLEAHPEHRAVVVIDNFLYKGEGNAIVHEKIAEWAAALVQSNVAHVIFLTNDSSYSKSLSKYLPDRVFRQTALGDLSPEVAKRFILSHINSELDVELETPEDASVDGNSEVDREKKFKSKSRPDLTELDEVIGTLGGRLTDLEFLARRLKTGQTPKRAVAEIIDQSASEILKMFLLPGMTTGDGEHKWSVEQAWYLIKTLASGESLRYHEVLLSDTFASSLSAPDGKGALEGLASAELITVRTRHGRPCSISVGKPVYQAAFAKLARDAVLRADMDLAVLKELSKIEAKNIDKAETELAILGSLPKQPTETADRIRYLLGKLQTSQKKVEGYDKQMGAMKKVLGSEY